MIEIRAGRAPLLDDALPQGAVPNDVVLQGGGLRAMCISGPNMGGKSSYMCQVCVCPPRLVPPIQWAVGCADRLSFGLRQRMPRA